MDESCELCLVLKHTDAFKAWRCCWQDFSIRNNVFDIYEGKAKGREDFSIND